ncbi:hypothetical protein LY28_00595 [Ruminiclostridium sufflavum DSM 19573]|uniref:Uncharacterized protein n=1 Tax=Ruminiclostridium sufflavum DSM 19573 TaxID=1121337 RepID=A0A318XNP8_9FIRM|nr:hypothetical protein [Ruminiclostridium sufflavum]PYG89376.1 hypothetical protein LY28_00595 [Ruminiclostridium sufflavum DSM 19573]
MENTKQKVKRFLCLPVTETVENKIGDVGKLEAEAIDNGLVLLKSQMTAIEVIETLEGLEKIIKELYLALVMSAGICEDCSCCTETEDAVSIKLPEFILEDAGIPKDAKLCAYTSEDSGEVTVVEAEYKHDLSDVPKGILHILKEIGVCMAGLNNSLMSEEIIYGKQICCYENKSDE